MRRKQKCVRRFGVDVVKVLWVIVAVVISCWALVILGALLPKLGGATEAPADIPHSITVSPGDTLWGYAREYWPQRDPRESVWHMRQLNPSLDPGGLRVGQVVKLREGLE